MSVVSQKVLERLVRIFSIIPLSSTVLPIPSVSVLSPMQLSWPPWSYKTQFTERTLSILQTLIDSSVSSKSRDVWIISRHMLRKWKWTHLNLTQLFSSWMVWVRLRKPTNVQGFVRKRKYSSSLISIMACQVQVVKISSSLMSYLNCSETTE